MFIWSPKNENQDNAPPKRALKYVQRKLQSLFTQPKWQLFVDEKEDIINNVREKLKDLNRQLDVKAPFSAGWGNLSRRRWNLSEETCASFLGSIEKIRFRKDSWNLIMDRTREEEIVKVLRGSGGLMLPTVKKVGTIWLSWRKSSSQKYYFEFREQQFKKKTQPN